MGTTLIYADGPDLYSLSLTLSRKKLLRREGMRIFRTINYFFSNNQSNLRILNAGEKGRMQPTVEVSDFYFRDGYDFYPFIILE